MTRPQPFRIAGHIAVTAESLTTHQPDPRDIVNNALRLNLRDTPPPHVDREQIEQHLPDDRLTETPRETMTRAVIAADTRRRATEMPATPGQHRDPYPGWEAEETRPRTTPRHRRCETWCQHRGPHTGTCLPPF